jgi:hypothetical protein
MQIRTSLIAKTDHPLVESESSERARFLFLFDLKSYMMDTVGTNVLTYFYFGKDSS